MNIQDNPYFQPADYNPPTTPVRGKPKTRIAPYYFRRPQITQPPLPKRIHRTIINTSSNRAGSVKDLSNVDIRDRVRNHAYMRVQIVYSKCLAHQGTAVRSDDRVRELYFKTQGSRLQVGRGTKEFHAAHPNPTSGVTDNYRDLIEQEALQDLKFTPAKRQMLLNRGLTRSQIDAIEGAAELDPEKFKTLLGVYFPKKPSMLDGTQISMLSNATNTLPTAVNLKCDKYLESKARPEIDDIYKRVAANAINAEEGVMEFCASAQDHLRGSIEIYKNKDVALERYADRLTQLQHNLVVMDDKELATQVVELMRELNLITKNSGKGIANIQLFINRQVLHRVRWNIYYGHSERAADLLKNKISYLLKEVEKKKKELGDLTNYCQWELEGSQVPDFRLLNNQHPSRLQQQLFQPAITHKSPPSR